MFLKYMYLHTISQMQSRSSIPQLLDWTFVEAFKDNKLIKFDSTIKEFYIVELDSDCEKSIN